MEIVWLGMGAAFVAVGSIALGRTIVKGFIAMEFLVGISVISLTVTPLIFINVDLIRPIIMILLALGYLTLIQSLSSRNKTKDFYKKFTVSKLFQEMTALLIPLIAFIKFHSSRYVFENHDVMYLGWIQEVFSNDYAGPLRLPTLYPVLSGANHFYSSSLVLITGVFSKDMNLVIAQNLKYILICFFYYLLLREFKPKQTFSFALASSVPWLLYGQEISYEFVISSSGYIFCLSLILFIIMSKDRFNIEHIQIILLVLAVSKAPIFFVPILVFAYIHFTINRFKFTRVNSLLMFLVFLNILSWAVTPKSTGSGSGIPQVLGLHPRIINGHLDIGLSAIKNSFNPWYLGHEGILLNRFDSQFAKIGIIFLLIFVKIYLTYFLLLRRQVHPKQEGSWIRICFWV